MLVSWNWLKQYVALDMPLDELTRRLSLAGLNLEGVREAAGDLVIDLEVTSNRPDCLGHIGVAREVAVLFDRELKLPSAQPRCGRTRVESLTSVTLDAPDLCPRYAARVLREVKVARSPDWLARRLEAVGERPVNNVVDVTNYVLYECGQPLHAFDYDVLREHRVVVRRARRGEKLTAINGRTLDLQPDLCVIADAERPVAVAGVMGGLDTEIGEGTTNVLLESAEFDPVAIRVAARRLNLHSPSSYRFERRIDPEGVDWASRRACELILELAGGELAEGVVYAGLRPAPRDAIVLRFDQIERVLGIRIGEGEAKRILERLGLALVSAEPGRAVLRPPSWRRDLTREIDLVEEVARIHGYGEIPEDAAVPLAVSVPRRRDRVAERVREVLLAAGFHEAMTYSWVSQETAAVFSPWSDRPPLSQANPLRSDEGALRMSLVPSLLEAARYNEARGNEGVRLFELARVYLPSQCGGLPEEPLLLSLVAWGSLADVKGVLEALAGRLRRGAVVDTAPWSHPLFASGRAAELRVEGSSSDGRPCAEPWGWIGELAPAAADRFDLRGRYAAAEVRFELLEQLADLAPRYEPVPQQPAVRRDLNLVVDEPVRWKELACTIRTAAGPALERLEFVEVFRGRQVPPGKKSVLSTLVYRAGDRTLTHDEVESFQQAVVAACAARHGATLRT